MKLVLEVGMPLDKNLIYYHEMLTKNGLSLVFSCITHDIYYTKENLDGLTENQMKNACERLRFCRGINSPEKVDKKLLKREEELIRKGYKKVFDTIKFDFQYSKKGMHSAVQLQDIQGVGLLAYYDNKDYYDFGEDEQRKMLLDELNSYGFEFKETDLGVDKLRTLYYGKTMYSKNQNG